MERSGNAFHRERPLTTCEVFHCCRRGGLCGGEVLRGAPFTDRTLPYGLCWRLHLADVADSRLNALIPSGWTGSENRHQKHHPEGETHETEGYKHIEHYVGITLAIASNI